MIITDENLEKAIDNAYYKGRIEQAQADAQFIQGFKDRYNDNHNFGDKSLDINYGTLCDMTRYLWKQLEQLRSEIE